MIDTFTTKLITTDNFGVLFMSNKKKCLLDVVYSKEYF